ncbi:MAG: hypothetical protein COC19_05045 [SAR86 cluster bacterium]|uniref:Alpha/beta hydrolase domain-containing protein n=1 Tax=SAR86 cluster bacterium TaxID=2030880 RepID=A0A2A4MMM1_9GAMM|nr:MAG: hypothetical protein COC19_05045 [SAR86 cluster bacterium]
MGRLFIGFLLAILTSTASIAGVSRIEISERNTLSSDQVGFEYEAIFGTVHFTLDPKAEANQAITDLAYAPVNSKGLVEYSTDFKLLLPSAAIASSTLMYQVNNRGRASVPPEISLSHPLSESGFTYLVTGWINEIASGGGRLRLHAPIVGSASSPITGDVRYEVGVGRVANDINIAGNNHLAYEPTDAGLAGATLSYRLNQDDPRLPIERSRFSMVVESVADSTQPVVTLHLDGDFQPGYIYELIYEAKNPVLAGAGMAAMRDMVALLRHGPGSSDGPEVGAQLAQLDLPEIEHTVAWGNSQSGRLLRLFLYEGFNADLQGRRVFDGVIPVIAGAGYGMFNNRFAMPTRTNGQHENQLFPNDLFPFTYDDSTDPFTGRVDGILHSSAANNTLPKIMHIQTVNEYWIRAGSLPHTNPEGTEDADLSDGVRFYTIGGSQHGSGSGEVRAPRGGQMPPNPSMWAPFTDSLIGAMNSWVVDGVEPPASRYPRISDGSLVASHNDEGRINRAAWKPMRGINHPKAMYVVGLADWGSRFYSEGIVDNHPISTERNYRPLVPAVDSDNNDLKASTVLPPLTAVPLATFVSWNLRAPETGAETELAYLSGGYIPFPANTASAVQSRDSRNSIAALYNSFEDYYAQYEAATDELIEQGYLLAGFKQRFMDIAEKNRAIFE